MTFKDHGEYEKIYAKYTDTAIAKKIAEMGYGVNFIAIGIGMVNNPRCDLDGAVSQYANGMEGLIRKALYALEEEEYDSEARNKVEE